MSESEGKGEKVGKVYSEGLISAKEIKKDLRMKEPPLVDVKVTNPVTYIKSWWKRVIGNEGIDVRVRVKPLTAIAISIIILTVTLGIGRFVFPFKIPFFVYTSEEGVATSDKVDYRNTAFTGELRHALLTNRYYLTTSSSEAINLQVPENVDLKDFVGRRIFAIGKYQEETRTLLVIDAADLELLPSEAETIPIVETEPNPEPSKDGEETEIPSDTSGETTP
jgi:hypothetical protein